MRRLDIDPTRVEMGWIIDFCAQALRNIVIGIGGRTDGFTMQSKFGIAVGPSDGDPVRGQPTWPT
jgi:formate--tetrahydrofolate ligase